MKLSELLKGIAVVEDEVVFNGLALNSAKVQTGDVFLAIAGVQRHGLCYAGQAIEKGALAVIYEDEQHQQDLINEKSVCLFIGVKNLGKRVGEIASRFYNNPTRDLDVIGITGTNGKTSCSHFLAQVLDQCAVIGTLGWGFPGQLQATPNTTPDALLIQEMMAEFVKRQIKTVAMEVSSHGLQQGRVNGITFSGVVFTNITRDHLDYHGSMEAYVKAKLALLEKPGIRFAVVNLDDTYSERIIAAISPGINIWGFSCKGKRLPQGESVTATRVQQCDKGLSFDVNWQNQLVTVHAPVFGLFNLENMVAVLSTLLAMDYTLADAAERMKSVRPVSGRMECFKAASKPLVFVDYAHTPDALAKVLASLKEHCGKSLWVVFGCGGDRDRGKRAVMGRIAEQWADHIVLTNDNPRTENAQSIIRDIKSGIKTAHIDVISDRKEAITKAVNQAASDDVVLIAGKGHEDYQDINGKKTGFSDINVVKELLNQCDGATGLCN